MSRRPRPLHRCHTDPRCRRCHGFRTQVGCGDWTWTYHTPGAASAAARHTHERRERPPASLYAPTGARRHLRTGALHKPHGNHRDHHHTSGRTLSTNMTRTQTRQTVICISLSLSLLTQSLILRSAVESEDLHLDLLSLADAFPHAYRGFSVSSPTPF